MDTGRGLHPGSQAFKDPYLRMLCQQLRATRPHGDLSDSEETTSNHVSWEMTAISLLLGSFKPPSLWCYFGKARRFLDSMVELGLGDKSMLI